MDLRPRRRRHADPLGRRSERTGAFDERHELPVQAEGEEVRAGERDVERLLGDAGIVRNRLKIESAIANARAVLDLESLDQLLWSFVGGKPHQNAWKTIGEIPAETEESKTMSKELKRRGFRFVGPTVCYAFMQACGLVNDHTVDCFRYRDLSS